MRNLQFYANECMQELDAIGIRYGKIQRFTINTRAKKRWGQCKYAYGKFEISIAQILLDERNSLDGLKSTIMHELLHTCKGCLNHGDEWKRLADIVSHYYGYKIERTASEDDKGICAELRVSATTNYNYIVRCTGCGNEIKHERMGNVVKNPSRYRCGRCHGKLEVSGIGKYQILKA